MARRLWVRRGSATVRPPQRVTNAPTRKGPGELAFGLVLLGVLTGLALVAQDHWKQGLSLIGATMIVACAGRLLLPPSKLGLLVVRSRLFDAATLALLGIAILAVTFQVPLPRR